MWKLWMASISLRRGLVHPLGLIRHAGRIILSVPSVLWAWFLRLLRFGSRKSIQLISGLFCATTRLGGHLYLFIWTLFNQTATRFRNTPCFPLEPTEPPTHAANLEVRRRPRVLIVSPYAVYPPHHGGGARLFNLVRELSVSCDVYLLIFSLIGEDRNQRRALESLGARVDYHHWEPRAKRDLFGLAPPGAQLFASQRAAEKIRDLVMGFDIDIVQLEYTELGQYRHSVPEGVPVILTEHDIAFRSFRRRREFGFNRRYPEGNDFGHSKADLRRLFRQEIVSCREVDQIHVMSESDGRFLARYLPDGTDRIRVIPNGVNTEQYRRVDRARTEGDVLFVGNYQNLPNVDALEYFVADVWPLVRVANPQIRLSVVGANASDRVLRFDGNDGILVIGRVRDIAHEYHRHRVLAAPIRAGSGTRLKILEAFAAGLPVVSTSIGAEGINAVPGSHLLIADNAVDFAESINRLMTEDDLHQKIATEATRLAHDEYDWTEVASKIGSSYLQLIGGPSGQALENRRPSNATRSRPAMAQNANAGSDPIVSIVIPTFCGGEALGRCLDAVKNQDFRHDHEVICVDSGSPAPEIEMMRGSGALVIELENGTFNHGLTRDLGASHARGPIVVFLNQDAIPSRSDWLDLLCKPFFGAGADKLAAVQGGSQEDPSNPEQFFWDSYGERFNFTREARRWIARYNGMGFSTVNCAIKRGVWDEHRFGWAPVLEDKKWQRAVTEAGYEIVDRPEALVFHTHKYDVDALWRRCLLEGYGWRLVGERYTLADCVRDIFNRPVLTDLVRGVRSKRPMTPAEFSFPVVRPCAIWLGNRFGRDRSH